MPKHMRQDEARAFAAALEFYEAMKGNAESAIKHIGISLDADSVSEGKRHRVMHTLFAYLVLDLEAFIELLGDYADIATDGLLDDEPLTDLDGLIEGMEGLQDQARSIRDALKAAPLLPLDEPEPVAEVSDPEPPAAGFRLDWPDDGKGVLVHESGRWFAVDKGTVIGPETYAIEPRFTPAERAEAAQEDGRRPFPTWVAMPRNGDRPGFEVAYFGDYEERYGDGSTMFVPDLMSACAAIFQLYFDSGDFVPQSSR
jgi:hypothetical protein